MPRRQMKRRRCHRCSRSSCRRRAAPNVTSPPTLQSSRPRRPRAPSRRARPRQRPSTLSCSDAPRAEPSTSEPARLDPASHRLPLHASPPTPRDRRAVVSCPQSLEPPCHENSRRQLHQLPKLRPRDLARVPRRQQQPVIFVHTPIPSALSNAARSLSPL